MRNLVFEIGKFFEHNGQPEEEKRKKSTTMASIVVDSLEQMMSRMIPTKKSVGIKPYLYLS
jgi:hypothetical protein